MKTDTAEAARDAAMLRRFREGAGQQGFAKWLGVEALSVEGDSITIGIDLREDMTQHHGYAHGGIVGTMADIACAWAGAMAAEADVVTSNYAVHLLAPARGARLIATGRAIRAGKRQVTVEARVICRAADGSETLVATALAAIAVLGPPRMAAG